MLAILAKSATLMKSSLLFPRKHRSSLLKKCGPWTHNIRITLRLVRLADPKALPSHTSVFISTKSRCHCYENQGFRIMAMCLRTGTDACQPGRPPGSTQTYQSLHSNKIYMSLLWKSRFQNNGHVSQNWDWCFSE